MKRIAKVPMLLVITLMVFSLIFSVYADSTVTLISQDAEIDTYGTPNISCVIPSLTAKYSGKNVSITKPVEVDITLYTDSTSPIDIISIDTSAVLIAGSTEYDDPTAKVEFTEKITLSPNELGNVSFVAEVHRLGILEIRRNDGSLISELKFVPKVLDKDGLDKELEDVKYFMLSPAADELSVSDLLAMKVPVESAIEDLSLGKVCEHSFELSDSSYIKFNEDGTIFRHDGSPIMVSCKLGVCSKCGFEFLEESSVCNHVFEFSEKVNATYTSAGYSLEKCVLCGITQFMDGTYQAKLACPGHKGGTATCTTGAVCEICNEQYGQPLGHKWTDATCTVAKTCSVCGKTEGNPLGHDYSELTVTKEPTCKELGEKTGYCSRDNATITEKIPVLEHTWDKGSVTTEPTCVSEGSITYTCTVCGTTKTESVIPLGHDWNSGAVKVAPTCEESGLLLLTCNRCQATKDETTNALGHDMLAPVTIKEASCTSDGVKASSCSRCSKTDTEVIPATGHTMGDFVTTVAPTATEAGSKTATCTVCGHTVTESIPATGGESSDPSSGESNPPEKTEDNPGTTGDSGNTDSSGEGSTPDNNPSGESDTGSSEPQNTPSDNPDPAPTSNTEPESSGSADTQE